MVVFINVKSALIRKNQKCLRHLTNIDMNLPNVLCMLNKYESIAQTLYVLFSNLFCIYIWAKKSIQLKYRFTLNFSWSLNPYCERIPLAVRLKSSHWTPVWRALWYLGVRVTGLRPKSHKIFAEDEPSTVYIAFITDLRAGREPGHRRG